MCLPRTIRILDSEELPFVIQQEQGWFAPPANEWNGGFVDFMPDEEDAFIPAATEEDEFGLFAPWSDNDTVVAPENILEDFGEFGLLGPEEDDDTDRIWNVYGGYERPRDADDWRSCWEFCTRSLHGASGPTHEFREWQSAYSDDDDDSDNFSVDEEHSDYY